MTTNFSQIIIHFRKHLISTLICFCCGAALLGQASPNDFVVVLDRLQDFGNIGSIVRTSRGFSIKDFLLVDMQSDPFSRKVIDSSRGSVFDSNFLKKEKDPIESIILVLY